MGRKNFGNSNIRVRVQDDGSRQPYNQHDDRGSVNRVWRRDGGGGGRGSGSRGRTFGKKSVSFSETGSGIRKRLGPKVGGGGGANLRYIALDEEDEGMGDSGRSYQSGRARPAIRGGHVKGKAIRRGGRGRARINPELVRNAVGSALVPKKSWYKVAISHGAKYPKEELLRMMLQACSVPFTPICYTKVGAHTHFFVDSKEMADALRELNQKVTLSDDFKLNLTINLSPPPSTQITDDVVEKIKIAMGSPERYVADTKALNLRKFYADNAFLGEPLYACLGKAQVMKRVVQIICDNIPHIEALELSENKLYTLDCFEDLTAKAPNVKILYLENNSLRDIKELEKCRAWKLLQLKLKGNPVVSKFSDTGAYQAAVRKIFPTLQVLDDVELPKLITFDDDDSATSLPVPVNKMSVGLPEQDEKVLEFLKAYYSIYDSDSRQPLLEAYHEQAIMSMSASYPTASVNVKGFHTYIRESRNLLRVPEEHRRERLLRNGKLGIVSFLAELPKSRHDLDSFTIDVTLATETVVCFTLTGLFQEREDSSAQKPLRHFSRMFVIMQTPTGGWNIVNETFFITPPTNKQTKNSFSGPQASSPPSNPVPSGDVQRGMIEQLSQKSGMNAEFSEMCLRESGWKLEEAFVAFQRAQSENKIPLHAFEKS